MTPLGAGLNRSASSPKLPSSTPTVPPSRRSLSANSFPLNNITDDVSSSDDSPEDTDEYSESSFRNLYSGHRNLHRHGSTQSPARAAFTSDFSSLVSSSPPTLSPNVHLYKGSREYYANIPEPAKMPHDAQSNKKMRRMSLSDNEQTENAPAGTCDIEPEGDYFVRMSNPSPLSSPSAGRISTPLKKLVDFDSPFEGRISPLTLNKSVTSVSSPLAQNSNDGFSAESSSGDRTSMIMNSSGEHDMSLKDILREAPRGISPPPRLPSDLEKDKNYSCTCASASDPERTVEARMSPSRRSRKRLRPE